MAWQREVSLADCDAAAPGIDRARVPRHVAIIMDGNGRWARKRGLPRTAGHRAGVKALREVVAACADIGVEYLTLFAFSTENWQRPRPEVSALMDLLVESLRTYLEELQQQGVRVRAIGHVDGLPPRARQAVQEAIAATAGNRRLTLVFALNYGGRREIVDAARAIARRVEAGDLRPEDIDETVFGRFLYTADLPDPDLLIRPSGEMRVSNFLLWQLAYTELYVTPVLWPDFSRHELFEAIRDFQRRERRFGRVGGTPRAGEGDGGC